MKTKLYHGGRGGYGGGVELLKMRTIMCFGFQNMRATLQFTPFYFVGINILKIFSFTFRR